MGRAAQQRHALLRDLGADDQRHLVLVTATPHSGKEEAFRSLLSLLDPSFAELPSELSGEANRRHRERLARHFVQRRRGDLADYLGDSTPFPKRESSEVHYHLSKAYRDAFDRVLAYCRERVEQADSDRRRARVRWWSALALLHALGSSPAAAVTSLHNRASGVDSATPEEADDLGRRAVFDLDEESAEGIDVTPGAQVEATTDGGDGVDDVDGGSPARRENKLLEELAEVVGRLAGKEDAKPRKATEIVRGLLDDESQPHGFQPIFFCRFIPTVEYLTEHLRQALPKYVEVAGGHRAPASRRTRTTCQRSLRKRSASPGLHRLSQRRHQSPGRLRRGRALRPVMESHPS